MSTVLVQVPSPYLKSVRSFNPRILDCLSEGKADLALRAESVTTRVLVIRQPRIFAKDLEVVPRVTADEVVMVINQGPRDLDGGREYYDVEDVRQRIEAYFGASVRWATIGPLVRDQMLVSAPGFPLEKHDWHNIIDVGEWWLDRPAPRGQVPVIGRHGRPAPVKWPQTAEEILQAYPATPDVKVRVLGGGELAAQRLGFVPESWDILPFGSAKPRDFLHSIDYFVYYHDPNLVEAFGRTILEAMASGVPAVLPEHFRPLFEDAALYAPIDKVQEVVQSLHSDWPRYREVAHRARDFADERFGYRSHIARLRELGVGTSAPSSVDAQPLTVFTTPRVAAPNAAAQGGARATMMLLSSNGAGLGHLTRLMSIARRLPSAVETVIATQSYAASVVEASGYLTEYVPSVNYLGINAKRWNEFFHDRLGELIRTHTPGVVAVDGTVPYNGLLRAISDHPDITWVWVRRAMWKKDQGERWIERGKAFDLILEPGEFAGEADEGPTVAERAGVKMVGPITYLDPSELLDAAAARTALGLGLGEGPVALLQLGAGNINDIASPMARISRHLMERGYQIVLAQSPIATRALSAPPGAVVASLYPVSQYIRAFDLVVSAAGYNSFHELIGFGIPTVFVPNGETALDDQIGRVRYAEQAGVCLALYDPAGSEVETVLDQAIRPQIQAALSQRCVELAFPNGAIEAASWMSALLPSRTGGM
jgi:UDP:flavonoid glycosyltransferase YjiC (YdhE family)